MIRRPDLYGRARALGFPAVEFAPGRWVGPGDTSWERCCSAASFTDLQLVEDGLERIETALGGGGTA